MIDSAAPDGGTCGKEFGGVLAPDVAGDVGADDPGCLRVRCLDLHAGQGKFARVIDALGNWVTPWFWPVCRNACSAD